MGYLFGCSDSPYHSDFVFFFLDVMTLSSVFGSYGTSACALLVTERSCQRPSWFWFLHQEAVSGVRARLLQHGMEVRAFPACTNFPAFGRLCMRRSSLTAIQAQTERSVRYNVYHLIALSGTGWEKTCSEGETQAKMLVPS